MSSDFRLLALRILTISLWYLPTPNPTKWYLPTFLEVRKTYLLISTGFPGATLCLPFFSYPPW